MPYREMIMHLNSPRCISQWDNTEHIGYLICGKMQLYTGYFFYVWFSTFTYWALLLYSAVRTSMYDNTGVYTTGQYSILAIYESCAKRGLSVPTIYYLYQQFIPILLHIMSRCIESMFWGYKIIIKCVY